MPARAPKADIRPEVLRWLRASSGLTIEETARKLGTRPENPMAWEAGEAMPSMPQLRKLATAFRRPISDFFLPEPVAEPSIPHDFRRLPDTESRSYSPALRHELRLASQRRGFALDLASDIATRRVRFDGLGTISPDDDPEAAAQHMRGLIGVEAGEQRGWRHPRTGYRAWRAKIEALNVLVFQIASVDPDQMLGFSLAHAELPVTGINRKLAPNGRSFTMLHEFAHLLLGASALCNLDESLPREPREQAIEVFCNHVAGAALVPRHELLEHPLVASAAPRVRDWEDAVLGTLARDFCASEEVIVRRLLIGGRTSRAFYARKRAEYAARSANLSQNQSPPDDFRRNMPQEAVSNLSAFARLVLHGYHADLMSLAEASRHLGVRASKVAIVDDLMR